MPYRQSGKPLSEVFRRCTCSSYCTVSPAGDRNFCLRHGWKCCRCGRCGEVEHSQGNPPTETFCLGCGHARDLAPGESEPLARYFLGWSAGTNSMGPR